MNPRLADILNGRGTGSRSTELRKFTFFDNKPKDLTDEDLETIRDAFWEMSDTQQLYTQLSIVSDELARRSNDRTTLLALIAAFAGVFSTVVFGVVSVAAQWKS